MKIAITGLANSGKTTIFNALTGLNLETTIYPTVTAEPHHGVVKVPDSSKHLGRCGCDATHRACYQEKCLEICVSIVIMKADLE